MDDGDAGFDGAGVDPGLDWSVTVGEVAAPLLQLVPEARQTPGVELVGGMTSAARTAGSELAVQAGELLAPTGRTDPQGMLLRRELEGRENGIGEQRWIGIPSSSALAPSCSQRSVATRSVTAVCLAPTAASSAPSPAPGAVLAAFAAFAHRPKPRTRPPDLRGGFDGWHGFGTNTRPADWNGCAMRPITRVMPLPLLLATLAPGAATADATPLGVYCSSGADSPFRAKPHSCAFYARGTESNLSAAQIRLHGLRWRTWGKSSTTSTATLYGNMGSRVRVRVRLSGRANCGSHRIYRHLRVAPRVRGGRAFTTTLPRCDAR